MFQYFSSHSNGDKLSTDKAKLTGAQVGSALYSNSCHQNFPENKVPVNNSVFSWKSSFKFFDDYIIPFLAKQLLFVAFL